MPTLAELRQQPHLSASGLRDYIDCGLHYFFGRIQKLRPEFISSALVLGSAVHSTLEDFHRCLLNGEAISEPELDHLFTLHLAKNLDKGGIPVRFKDGETAGSMAEQGQSLVRLYVKGMDQSAKVVAVEHAFALEIRGLKVPVIGAFDLLLETTDGELTIVELKTSSKGYGAKEVDDSDQLTIYQMAAREMGYADRDIGLRIDTLVKTKTPRLESHYTARTETDEERLCSKLKAMWRGIELGHFLPNDGSWKCAGCGYRKACAEWGMSEAA